MPKAHSTHDVTLTMEEWKTVYGLLEDTIFSREMLTGIPSGWLPETPNYRVVVAVPVIVLTVLPDALSDWARSLYADVNERERGLTELAIAADPDIRMLRHDADEAVNILTKLERQGAIFHITQEVE